MLLSEAISHIFFLLSYISSKNSFPQPMSAEEAILQMNLLAHDFFVFRSSEDESLCIVYQRKNGGYGMIVTDEED